MPIDRVNFLDLHFDRLSLPEVKSRLQAVSGTSPYQYLVTPNVDHVVRVHREPALRHLYENADLCVCDSRVLKLLARLCGIRLPLVPGSDLSATLFRDVIKPGDRIAVVGMDSSALATLQAKFPEICFVHFQPPMNLRTNAEARSAAAAFIAHEGARFSFIAVGSPQQEMIAKTVRQNPSATGLGLCIGAGLDFITGKQKRAPKFVQLLGLEWAHRLLSNPSRFWRRYMVDGLGIFPIWFRWRARRSHERLISAICAVALLVAGILYVGTLLEHQPNTGTSVDIRLPQVARESAAAVQSLPPPNLIKPVSIEEATKENAERPFASRPDTPASRFVLHADTEDRTRARTCLAQAVYYEAAGEGTDGGRAVAQVVLNRVRHPGFPSTICGVVYEGADRPTGCQFSFTCDGSMQHVPAPSLWARSEKIAEEALKGRVFAPVGHTTHYHADYVLPYWADSLDKSVQIGRHIFYRLRGVYGDGRAFSQRYSGAEPPVREPGAAIVVPLTPENQRLAEKLIGQEQRDPAKSLDAPAPKPEVPLVIDQTPSTLLVDGEPHEQRQHRAKQTDNCSRTEGEKLGPLRATDLHSDVTRSTC